MEPNQGSNEASKKHHAWASGLYVYVEMAPTMSQRSVKWGVSNLGLSITALLKWLLLQPNVKGIAWAEVLVHRLYIRENVRLQARYSYNVDIDKFNSL